MPPHIVLGFGQPGPVMDRTTEDGGRIRAAVRLFDHGFDIDVKTLSCNLSAMKSAISLVDPWLVE